MNGNPRGAKLRQALRRYGPWALSAGLFFMLYLYLRHELPGIGFDVRRLQWGYAALVIGTRAVSYGLLGLSLASFGVYWGIPLPFVEWYGLTVSSLLVNTLTPIGGGAVVRGAYLKMRYGLAVARFAPPLAATILIQYFISGLMGLAAVAAVTLWSHQPVNPLAAALMACLALGPAVALIFPVEKLPLPQTGRLAGWVRTLFQGWRELRNSPRLLVEQTSLAAAFQLLYSVSAYWAMFALGIPVSLVQAIFLGALLSAWRVTPEIGPGISELIAGLAGPLVGVTPAQGILAALVIRLANLACLLTLGPIYSIILSRRLGQPLATLSEGGRSSAP
jgi:hypothetical protein